LGAEPSLKSNAVVIISYHGAIVPPLSALSAFRVVVLVKRLECKFLFKAYACGSLGLKKDMVYHDHKSIPGGCPETPPGGLAGAGKGKAGLCSAPGLPGIGRGMLPGGPAVGVPVAPGGPVEATGRCGALPPRGMPLLKGGRAGEGPPVGAPGTPAGRIPACRSHLHTSWLEASKHVHSVAVICLLFVRCCMRFVDCAMLWT
jgi:hypothetical protein